MPQHLGLRAAPSLRSLYMRAPPPGFICDPVCLDHVSWEDEDDDSIQCPGQEEDGNPESGEFGAFNIHLQNSSGTDIPDQGCEVRVLNSSLGSTVDEAWHDYPMIPAGGGAIGAASPWHITGVRIPCGFTGCVTGDVTIRCEGHVGQQFHYQLFTVVPP